MLNIPLFGYGYRNIVLLCNSYKFQFPVKLTRICSLALIEFFFVFSLLTDDYVVILRTTFMMKFMIVITEEVSHYYTL